MIAAAGSGQRLGAGGPKAFVDLAGRPMIEWSLAALAAAERIARIVIAAPAGWESPAELAAANAVAGTEVEVVPGGETRAESVSAALGAIATELVVICDAARPMLEAPLVDRVLARLGADPTAGAAIAATPVTDTIKRAMAGRGGATEDRGPAIVAETLDRETLWAAQTPQAFRVDGLRGAQEAARAEGALGRATDEAWLIEFAGGRVLIEPTGPENLKVTTAADLVIAEALLAQRRSST